jgi:hypothetical protein
VNIFSSRSVKNSRRHSISFLIKSGIHWFSKKTQQFNCIWESGSMRGIFGYLWPNFIELFLSWWFQILIWWEKWVWHIVWWRSPVSRNCFGCLFHIVFWNIMKFVESIISV